MGEGGDTLGDDEPSKEEGHEDQKEGADICQDESPGKACDGSELSHTQGVTEEADGVVQEEPASRRPSAPCYLSRQFCGNHSTQSVSWPPLESRMEVS